MDLVRQQYKSSTWKVEKLVKWLLKVLATAPEGTILSFFMGKRYFHLPSENSYIDAEQPSTQLQIYVQ